jgi:hypothetical protein
MLDALVKNVLNLFFQLLLSQCSLNYHYVSCSSFTCRIISDKKVNVVHLDSGPQVKWGNFGRIRMTLVVKYYSTDGHSKGQKMTEEKVLKHSGLTTCPIFRVKN